MVMVLLVAGNVAQGQSPFEQTALEPAPGPLDHLRLERVASVDGERFRIGSNAFTVAQLHGFILSIERFLSLAGELPLGQHVTLRQDGERGYIALTAYDAPGAPAYVLTFAAHEPTGFASRTAVEALSVLLAEQIAGGGAATAPSALP